MRYLMFCLLALNVAACGTEPGPRQEEATQAELEPVQPVVEEDPLTMRNGGYWVTFGDPDGAGERWSHYFGKTWSQSHRILRHIQTRVARHIHLIVRLLRITRPAEELVLVLH